MCLPQTSALCSQSVQTTCTTHKKQELRNLQYIQVPVIWIHQVYVMTIFGRIRRNPKSLPPFLHSSRNQISCGGVAKSIEASDWPHECKAKVSWRPKSYAGAQRLEVYQLHPPSLEIAYHKDWQARLYNMSVFYYKFRCSRNARVPSQSTLPSAVLNSGSMTIVPLLGVHISGCR